MIVVPSSRRIDRNRFHCRRIFCSKCEHFGNASANGRTVTGCKLMPKPCDIESAWLTDKEEWCPDGKAKDFRDWFPYKTKSVPPIRSPTSWVTDISTRSEIAVVTIAVGSNAREILEYTQGPMEWYANKVGADFISLVDDQFQDYRIGNKFRLAEIGKLYERVLFIDMDVWLTDGVPNLFKLPTGKVWAHPDAAYLPSFAFFDADCGMLEETQRVNVPKQMKVYNTGVVLFDNEHSSMWESPRLPFYDTHTAEQTWVEIQARNNGFVFADFPLRYNLQWWMRQKWGRTDALIYHLANCPHKDRIAWLKRRSSGRVPAAV